MNQINKNIILFFLYFIILIVFSSFGFKVIGGNSWSWIDSIYMTIITLSSVGFSEVHPLNDDLRIWAMLVIFLGVIGVGILFSSLRDIFSHYKIYRRNRMISKIKKLKNHYIICGFGRMGAVIATELQIKKKKFVIIDNDSKKIEKIIENQMLYIKGDATLDSTLELAGINNASSVAVVLDTDQDNLFVALTIRSISPKIFLLSRCSNDDNRLKLIRSGANKVINPYVAGGHRMAEMLITPSIEDSISMTSPLGESVDFSIDEISIKNIIDIHNVSIQDSNIKINFSVSIVGVIKQSGETTINPTSDTILEKGDTILILGEKENISKFIRTYRL